MHRSQYSWEEIFTLTHPNWATLFYQCSFIYIRQNIVKIVSYVQSNIRMVENLDSK